MTSLHLPAGVLVLQRGWLSANNIVIAGRESTAVVDTGYCTHAAQTLALIQGVLQGRPLDCILNTHLHSDHCGGNAALQDRYSEVKTLIPPGQMQAVKDWDPVALTYEPTGQQCPRFQADASLRPGTEIKIGDAIWQIHAAPGHDPHSVILFEPETRTLISADALWENGFGVVFPELEGEDAFELVGATLDLIESLSPRTVIPGHGAPFEESHIAVATARQRLEGFMKSPIRHAGHAAKVLMKFKLLEIQESPWPEFLRWMASTPYFWIVHKTWFPDKPFERWLEDLRDGLIQSGAAAMFGASLQNVDR